MMGVTTDNGDEGEIKTDDGGMRVTTDDRGIERIIPLICLATQNSEKSESTQVLLSIRTEGPIQGKT